MNRPHDLRRVIGLAGGTALIVGITIGSGIFRTPPTIAGLVPNPLVIMGLWTAVGLISICGALVGAAVSEVTTLVKVTALAAIILGAFLLGHGTLANITEGGGGGVQGGGLARAVAAVIWTYDGWIGVSMIAGEVVAPERLMKRIIIVGMLVIVTLYIGANLAYLYIMPVSIMAQQKEAIARTVMTAIAGPAGGAVIMLAIMTSVFGALNGNLLAKPRVPYAMARDGLIFAFLGKTHPRWATPWAALAIQGAVAIIMVLVLRDYDTLITYFVVVEWAALVFAVGAVFVLRRKMAERPRPFRTPAYPWVPLCFVCGTVGGVSAIVWGQIQVGNVSPVYGLGIAAAGFPVHYLWKRLTRTA